VNKEQFCHVSVTVRVVFFLRVFDFMKESLYVRVFCGAGFVALFLEKCEGDVGMHK